MWFIVSLRVPSVVLLSQEPLEGAMERLGGHQQVSSETPASPHAHQQAG